MAQEPELSQPQLFPFLMQNKGQEKKEEGKQKHDQETTGRYKKTQTTLLEIKWPADTLSGQNILYLTNITFS